MRSDPDPKQNEIYSTFLLKRPIIKSKMELLYAVLILTTAKLDTTAASYSETQQNLGTKVENCCFKMNQKPFSLRFFRKNNQNYKKKTTIPCFIVTDFWLLGQARYI